MRIKESKLFSMLVTVLAVIWQIYFAIKKDVWTLQHTIVLVACLVFQLSGSLRAFLFKRNDLMFHGLSGFEWAVEIDCALTMLYVALFPASMYGISLHLVSKEANVWVYGIMFIIYMLAIALGLIAEAERYMHKLKGDPDVNYRLVGLWSYSWNINYFAETISLPTLVFLGTGRWILALLILLVVGINFNFIQIPNNREYIEENYPEDAGEILARPAYIPFLF